MCVYREVLHHSPAAIVGEALGLGALIVAVFGLSRSGAPTESVSPGGSTPTARVPQDD